MLEGQHFQIGYVTRNRDRWIDTFRDNGDVDQIMLFEGPNQVRTVNGPATMDLKIALIWIGDTHFELIEPVAGDVSLYTDALPADDSLQFHHVCRRVPDWADFRARVDRQPFPVVLEGTDAQSSFVYLDTRAFLGHYVEYAWIPDDRWAQTIESVRRSGHAEAGG